MNNWKLYFMNQNDQRSDLAEFYDKSYECWHSVWYQTLKELDGIQKLYSDEFTRREYICSIFNENECVGLILFHKLNFAREASWSDSYFSAWPKKALQKLCSDGTEVLVGAYVTVSPKYRGNQNGFLVKDLIVEIAVQLLLETDCNSLSGTMRNNKGMDKSAYRSGATPIQKDVPFHGVNVDLVGFYKKHIVSEKIVQSFVSQSLWRNKVIAGDVKNKNLYKKEA